MVSVEGQDTVGKSLILFFVCEIRLSRIGSNFIPYLSPPSKSISVDIMTGISFHSLGSFFLHDAQYQGLCPRFWSMYFEMNIGFPQQTGPSSAFS